MAKYNILQFQKPIFNKLYYCKILEIFISFITLHGEQSSGLAALVLEVRAHLCLLNIDKNAAT